MSLKLIQGQDYRLASAVIATATEFTLNSFNTPNGGAITVSDLETINYGTLDPDTDFEEIISFTSLTTNVDGSVTLTGVVRGLKFIDPFDQDTNLRQPHSANATFVLSNNPQTTQGLVSNTSDETITGKFTFETVPASTASAVAGDDLVNLTQLNAAALGSSNIDKNIVAGTSGEAVVAGQIGYFDETDKEWKLADASTSATCENVMLSIFQGAGIDGGAITNGTLILGRDKNQSGFTAGDKIYISNTAGTLINTPGTVEVQVGYAKSATEIYFNPNYFKTVATKNEKDALGGTSGTAVSSSNKLVDDDDTSATSSANKVVRMDSNGLIDISISKMLILWSDGNDGDTTISTTVSLTKDMNYKTLTISSGGILKTNGYRVFAHVINIQSGGKIEEPGNNGANGQDEPAPKAGGAGGVATHSAGSVQGASTGGAGGASGSSAQGSNGVNGGDISACSLGVDAGDGGDGAGFNGAGGTKGTITLTTSNVNLFTIKQSLVLDTDGLSVKIIGGSGSGAGGGGAGHGSGNQNGSGGGGGSAGGNIFLFSEKVTINGTIDIYGGAGGNGGAGSYGGGAGGGAGGGILLLACRVLSGSGTVNLYGGDGGTGGTGGTESGVAGDGGDGGNFYKIYSTDNSTLTVNKDGGTPSGSVGTLYDIQTDY
jgi:hypothetical protein